MDRDMGENNLGHPPPMGAANRCIRNIGTIKRKTQILFLDQIIKINY